MTLTLVVGLLIPLLGTVLGSAFVFLMKDAMSVRLQKSLLGFASDVMVAASVWSLLIPSMEMMADGGRWSVLPAQQSEHHRLCHWLRADDGARRGDGVARVLIIFKKTKLI